MTDQSSGHGGPRSPRRVERPLPGRALPLATAFRRFAQAQASGGIVLLAAIVVALIWANMPGGSYEWVWNSEIVVGIRGASAEFTLQDVVNQGLMAFFFLLVTLEIKREVLVGELTPPRRAVLPLLAAVGGMALPALIYLVVNLGRNSQGWAIPIATDIALVGGVMALLGRRLSTPVQVFMLALAIVDDILAILVIAIFYTGAVSPFPVVMLAVLALVLALMNWLGVRYVWIWLTLGFLFWFGLIEAHIEATLAGVALAVAIPARSRVGPQDFIRDASLQLQRFEAAAQKDACILCNEEMGEIAADMRTSASHVRAPLSLLEDALRYWVVFFVMPVFALANGGIPLDREVARGLADPVVLGVMLGLIFGKQFGIFLLSRASVALGFARLPAGASWIGIYSVAWLGGIGFTIAIFIADLAFPEEPILPSIKAGILIASLVSGFGGWVLLRLTSRSQAATAEG